MTRHRFCFAVWLLTCLVPASVSNAFAMPSPLETGHPPALMQGMSGAMRFAQAQPAPVPAPATPSPAQPTDAQSSNDEPIGNVATLTGSATVIRNKNSMPLKLKDDIYLNDVLRTSADSTLGVTFNDATTFNLTANARITIDSFVYEDGGKQNAALFDVAKGTVAFVAAAVARTGDMKISTPTATMGIRGTTGVVEVPEGASAGSANHVAIKLYPDADGKVGRIEINDRAGARLGFLTQGASGFAIRPGAGGRFTALPLQISRQQAQRDQGFVRQVHAAQSVGRQVVTEQRALRRANPALNNPNRTNQPRQPGPPRQNGLPQRPGTQQPAAPTPPGTPPRTGQPQQPGGQAQPAPQNRPAVPQPPALQRPGIQQGAPGVQRPPLQRPGLPGLPQKRPPKGKQPKERR